MGISIQQYRAAIGLYNMCSFKTSCCDNLCTYLFILLSSTLVFTEILLMLLILSGDIELNPGPDSEHSGFLDICHLNIHSLSDKITAVKASLAGTYDIIAITETLLRPHHDTSKLELKGYHPLIHRDRDDRGGGGCAVYVRDSLHYIRLNQLESRDVESIWLRIRAKNNVFLLCTCYRPPDAHFSFWDSMQIQVDLAKQIHHNIVITGDLNADPNSLSGPDLGIFADQNHFTIHINEPTRITENTATILDQFMGNIDQFIHDIMVLPPLSNNDHCTISAKVRFKVFKQTTFTRRVWLYDQADYPGLRSAIQEYDWDECFMSDNVDEACDSWTNAFYSLISTFIPNRIVNIRPHDCPYYTSELRKQKRKLDRLHTKAKNSNNSNDVWSSFRAARNEYQRNLKDAEMKYNENLASKLKNNDSISPRRWWSIAKSFLGFKSESTLPPIIDGDKLHFDNLSKAEAFNAFFLNHSTLDTSNAILPDMLPTTDSFIDSVIVSENEVLNILKSLDVSKSTGPDNISPRMLRETAESITPSLTKLFRLSLNNSHFPSIWKRANVLPLHKKNNKDAMNNYRPISLLSCVGKVLEKIVFKFLFNYFRENFLLSIYQSGFMPGDSTVNQLVQIYHMMCEALDKQKEVRLVFCDISKAFDRVWHDGLIHKLECIGVRGNLLIWLKDYLHNRQQRVVIGGKHSSWGTIHAGVPQGSVLGPLLFLVFINDITTEVNCNIRLFADDTTIFITVDDPIEAAEVLNSNLESISLWAKKWLITFSPPKTECLTVTRKRNPNHPPIYFDGSAVSEVQHHKHLGVTLSNDLKWETHINDIVSKAGKRADILSRLMYKVDRKTLEIMYKSFIRPIIEYGDVLLSNISDGQAYKIECVQKRCARVVSGGIRGTSGHVLYEELGWESLCDRREKHRIYMLYKILHGNTPNYLKAILPESVSKRTNYPLRNADHLDTDPFRCRTVSFLKSYFPSTVRDWNLLDPQIKSLPNFDAFKVSYCQRDPKPNSFYYLGQRRTGIIHARIRMKCSLLNAHLYEHGIIKSPKCSCGHKVEDSLHYFLVCQRYQHERAALHASIIEHVPFTLYHLLNGTKYDDVNDIIAKAVHLFIEGTHRFTI